MFQVMSNNSIREPNWERLTIGKEKIGMDGMKSTVMSRREKIQDMRIIIRNIGSGKFSNCCDSCTVYLNNPMFYSLHNRGRHNLSSNYTNNWCNQDKPITLRPNCSGGHRTYIKKSCRVLWSSEWRWCDSHWTKNPSRIGCDTPTYL